MKTPSMSHATHVGLFVVVLYVLCLLWPFIYPYPTDVAAFHLLSLKLTFPGFQNFSLPSLVWGGVLSFVYGFVGSMIFHGLHKTCCK